VSLDVYLYPDGAGDSGVSGYCANITHNLNALAAAVGLYEPLWRPEELGLTRANQLIDLLERGLRRLADPERREEFRKLEPSNGWGSFDGLVKFTREYLEACRDYPQALIRVSR
jgi:hypothetical protein